MVNQGKLFTLQRCYWEEAAIKCEKPAKMRKVPNWEKMNNNTPISEHCNNAVEVFRNVEVYTDKTICL